ncbi:dTDP-glucose 4,6-dehydratase [Endozoicomonas sp. OPT23]|uniref:PhoX family protein n=1 Tax=Endozoicomonas sp. OPT23 TaxID=2072845 RepID=UPI00129B7E8B|nr:PhoX family phosphatase [Endozoicomonas sp. OPT23]MRI31838.1 dTDP-glucose 4,6-dehydratase [Endozoicomonas sp. OPT23]
MSKFTFDPTIYNKSDNKPISTVLEKELSRRGVLKRGGILAAFGAVASTGLVGCDSSSSSSNSTTPASQDSSLTLGFDSIPGSKLDSVAVPSGYSAQVLAPWGTPLNSNANPWKIDGSNTSDDQLNSVGMHHDGMHFFPLEGSSTEGLLCVNHEYIDRKALHPEGRVHAPVKYDEIVPPFAAEEARKEIYAHGVSVIHIRLTSGVWDVVANSPYNNRFTSATEMDISGPVAGSELLQTPYTESRGKLNIARGTMNNCGNGHTPWGTYLTCEENWPGYFVHKGTMTEGEDRIGFGDRGSRYQWDTIQGDSVIGEFSRFNITPTGANATEDYRNEANGHGYIVEIDPFSPGSKAVKRTAMGRFRHEDCSFGKVEAGKPIVYYSGHDGRFEYIYKFVSKELWAPEDANSTNKLATGAKYLDEGVLYVAQFNESGKGVWVPLVASTPIPGTDETLGGRLGSLANIILNTPLAADWVKATPMDRPEWTAVDPVTGSVYVTLTNNTKRNNTDDSTSNDTNVANPRDNNKFGHIIRWDEGSEATSFSWEFFLFGSPAAGDVQTNLSGLTSANELASPDGLVFDDRGILWVQTDNGADEVEENTNDQMLAIIPSELSSKGDKAVLGSENQDQLKRFFVGPNGSEVTGLAFTGDNKNFFINIQHPGNWPAYGTRNAAEASSDDVRPRAATVVITKDDSGEIAV